MPETLMPLRPACAVNLCTRAIESQGLCSLHRARFRRHGTPTGGRVILPAGGPCSVVGCEHPAKAKLLCSRHYLQCRRTGSPDSTRAAPGEPARWAEQAAQSPGNDDCLSWPFGRNAAGYGLLSHPFSALAHRVICLLTHGPPPEGRPDAAHTCGNGAAGCVNPRHLRWLSHAENQAEMVVHGHSTKGMRTQSRCKLSERDVHVIRDSAESASALAKRFGVAPDTIRKVRGRKTWLHLPSAVGMVGAD